MQRVFMFTNVMYVKDSKIFQSWNTHTLWAYDYVQVSSVELNIPQKIKWLKMIILSLFLR